jgi:hypothetical protein
VILELRHACDRTTPDGTQIHTWALWCRYRPDILGAVVLLPPNRNGERFPAAGEVGGWDWTIQPVRVAA